MERYEYPEWFQIALSDQKAYYLHKESKMLINTLEGRMIVNSGDYIIQGVKGEIYPCRCDIFLETYEKVESQDNE